MYSRHQKNRLANGSRYKERGENGTRSVKYGSFVLFDLTTVLIFSVYRMANV